MGSSHVVGFIIGSGTGSFSRIETVRAPVMADAWRRELSCYSGMAGAVELVFRYPGV